MTAMANGIQNGVSSAYSANLIRSTHLTGTSTDSTFLYFPRTTLLLTNNTLCDLSLSFFGTSWTQLAYSPDNIYEEIARMIGNWPSWLAWPFPFGRGVSSRIGPHKPSRADPCWSVPFCFLSLGRSWSFSSSRSTICPSVKPCLEPGDSKQNSCPAKRSWTRHHNLFTN